MANKGESCEWQVFPAQNQIQTYDKQQRTKSKQAALQRNISLKNQNKH